MPPETPTSTVRPSSVIRYSSATTCRGVTTSRRESPCSATNTSAPPTFTTSWITHVSSEYATATSSGTWNGCTRAATQPACQVPMKPGAWGTKTKAATITTVVSEAATSGTCMSREEGEEI